MYVQAVTQKEAHGLHFCGNYFKINTTKPYNFYALADRQDLLSSAISTSKKKSTYKDG